VTTSKARLEHMREAVTRLPFSQTQAKRFLWGTTEEQATKETLLSRFGIRWIQVTKRSIGSAKQRRGNQCFGYLFGY